MSLKQFVPSEVCLKCDGCCRFKAVDSPWRPRLGAGERVTLGAQITDPGWLGRDHHVAAAAAKDGCACTFFNAADNTCRIYAHRPFECLLYPFVLSRSAGGAIGVYRHLSCPYVQDHLNTPALDQYTEYLKGYFQEPGTRQWLLANQDLVHDYAEFALELQHCFDVDPAGSEFLLAWRPEFDRHLNRTPRDLSSYNFAAVFLWADFFEFEFESVGDHGVALARQGKTCFAYLPPLGVPLDETVVRACFERMGRNPAARIENVPAEDAPLLSAMGYRVREKSMEYIYRREDIAALAGNAYKSQRHDVNLCERQAGPAMSLYRPEDFDGCMKVFAAWSRIRKAAHPDELYGYMMDDNVLVHGRMLRYADALGLTVRVARVGGEVAGYTAGYPLNDDTFCVYAEVADPAVPGLSAWIFSQLCRDRAVEPYAFINAMDDFGMPGVARSKQLWHPVRTVPVYTASA